MRQNRSFITTRSWVKHASAGMAAALFLCTLLPKSSNYEGSASGAGGHLDVCLPGRVTVKWPSSQTVHPHWGSAPAVPPSPEPVAGVLPQWSGGAVMRL